MQVYEIVCMKKNLDWLETVCVYICAEGEDPKPLPTIPLQHFQKLVWPKWV